MDIPVLKDQGGSFSYCFAYTVVFKMNLTAYFPSNSKLFKVSKQTIHQEKRHEMVARNTKFATFFFILRSY